MGGVTAQAQRLRRAYNEADIWFTDSVAIPSVLLDSGRYMQLPPTTSATFLHEVLKKCLDVSADKLVVLRPEEWKLLSVQTGLFEEYGVELVKSC